ncbi:hypothetical protein [Sporomusa aerivorans]|uniref:hypothetical protein n=1 Tax=Sporomusa aerivorans TaxID=204936 RepID=UPI00352B9A15
MKKMLVLMIAMFVLSLSSMVSAHDNQQNLVPNYQMLAAADQPQLDPNDPHHKQQPKSHNKQQPQKQQPQPEQPKPEQPR